VCKEPLVVLELDDVEVDYCTSCSGIWLDAGELELLLGDAAGKDRFLSSFEICHTVKEAVRKCPICSKKMDKVLLGHEDQVCIDRCRNNDGIWLDRGELEEIFQLNRFGEDHRVLALLKDLFGRETSKGG
jgi:Zn-finger nucleic acid-binding protein